MNQNKLSDRIINQPKRPHSTNIPGPRTGKRSILVTQTHGSNKKLNQSTLETEAEDQKLNQIIKASSFQKRKVNDDLTNYNFYSKNKDNNLSLNSQDNDFSEELQNIHLRSIMFQSEGQNMFDGSYNPLFNSLNMSNGFIEPPPNVHTDLSLGEGKNSSKKQKNNNLSFIIQSKSSKVQQTNAFHTKIPPKKQNQTQLLIKYINSEGQSHTCRQIEKAKLIQQHHFYDDIFLGDFKPQENKQQNNKHNASKNQAQQQQQLINVSSFNKNFYVSVNVNKKQRSKRNSIGTSNLTLDEHGKLVIQQQTQSTQQSQNNTQNSVKNQNIQNTSVLSQQFQPKASFPGRKLSVVNKETLNMIVKRLSQSMYQDNRLSVASLNNSQDMELTSSNFMGSAPQSRMLKVSQTQKNSFFNRNNSLQSSNRAQTANKTSRNESRQPCVKGVSIKNYYRSKALTNILSSQDNNNLSLSVLMPQNQASMGQDMTQRDYQHLINQRNNSYNQTNKNQDSQNQLLAEQFRQDNNMIEETIQFDENQFDNPLEQQDKNTNFLRSQAECYNSSVDKQINNYIKDVKKSRINSESDRRRKESSFLIQAQSQRSKDGVNGGKQTHTSFNFYSQNQQQLNLTGNNFKNKQSQLVENGNHIERKLSNMSQDSHPYLETLVFGEYGTLESAIAKSNTQGITEQFNQLNHLEEQKKLNQEEFQQQYPLSSRYLENLAKSKGKNLNRKVQKSNQIIENKNEKELLMSRESETVGDLFCYDDNKSQYKQKKRCASAREEAQNLSSQRCEDLKEKFLKNLNLRGQRQSSQDDLRSAAGSQSSLKEMIIENNRQTNSLIRQDSSSDKLQKEQMKNSSSQNLDEITVQNNSTRQIKQNSQFKSNTMSLNKRKLSSDYTKLIKVYEQSLATRTIEMADQQNLNQITPISLEEINNSDKINKNDRKSVVQNNQVLKNEKSQLISENSEAFSVLKQVYNPTRQKGNIQDENQSDCRQIQSLATQADSLGRQIFSNLNTEQYIVSSQNTGEINLNSQRRQLNKNPDLNGMFMPYQKEEQQKQNTVDPSLVKQQKIIHSNFPQKINTKFLKSKNLTNSQLYSFLLQKQSVNSSLDNSMITIAQKDVSQNNSQIDINKIKSQQYSNSLRNSSLNNSINCNTTIPHQEGFKNRSPPPSGMIGARPNSMSYNNRKHKKGSQKLDTEETLQPWNDYTYVKYF